MNRLRVSHIMCNPPKISTMGAEPRRSSLSYRITLGRLLIGLVVVDALLFLSEGLGWLPKRWAVPMAMVAVVLALPWR